MKCWHTAKPDCPYLDFTGLKGEALGDAIEDARSTCGGCELRARGDECLTCSLPLSKVCQECYGEASGIVSGYRDCGTDSCHKAGQDICQGHMEDVPQDLKDRGNELPF